MSAAKPQKHWTTRELARLKTTSTCVHCGSYIGPLRLLRYFPYRSYDSLRHGLRRLRGSK